MLSPGSVLITGANRGIGLEFCKHFLKLEKPPTHIFACCRNPESAEDLKRLIETSPALSVIQLDVCDEGSIERSRNVVEKKLAGEGLNLLINNAGYLLRYDMYQTKKEDMMKSFEVNAVGPLMVVQEYLSLLKKAAQSQADAPMSCNKSAIINMSTGVASITENSSGGRYPYRTSKAAQNMITSNLSFDLKSDGILCSALHPGYVKTDMGGPNAFISTDESVKAMMAYMATLVGEEGTGKFYHCIQDRALAW